MGFCLRWAFFDFGLAGEGKAQSGQNFGLLIIRARQVDMRYDNDSFILGP